MSASAVLVWQRQAIPLVRRRLESAIGHRVMVGSVGLTWRLQVVARDIEIAGAPPFDSQNLVRIDRAVVRLRGTKGWLSPSEVLVDGMDIDYLATADGDNLRGVATSRKSAASAGTRADRGALPITIRNARLRGTIAPRRGPQIGIRARQVEATYDGKGGLRADLCGMVIDAQGLASIHASNLKVERAEGGQVRLSGASVAVEIPGGGTLLDNLTLQGGGSLSASAFELHSNEARAPHVNATLSWNPQSAVLSAKLHDLPMRALGVLAGGRAFGLENARAELQARVTLDRPALSADFELDGKISDVDVIHPAVDATPWRNQSFALSAEGQADLRAAHLDLKKASFKGLGATVRMKASLDDFEAPRGTLTAFTPPAEPLSCSALLVGQPAPIQRALAGLDLQGSLGFEVSLTFDSAAWQDLQLAIDVNPICSVKSESRTLSELLPLLRKPTTAQPPAGIKLPLGPFHPDFVPLSQMPVHLPSAFITSEDSKFFHHRGFDTELIRSALAQDLGNRSFDRGASTITQQLAKNLFLTHRRNLARKLEEAVLTWRLQKLLSKDRVLEIYLNVIELGPGIRGVKQAARRYFGKDVTELTPIESAHLAALTPNPHALARRFRDGQVDEGWLQRLYDLLGMMKRYHRLSAEELAAARTSKLELRDLGKDVTLPRPN